MFDFSHTHRQIIIKKEKIKIKILKRKTINKI